MTFTLANKTPRITCERFACVPAAAPAARGLAGAGACALPASPQSSAPSETTVSNHKLRCTNRIWQLPPGNLHSQPQANLLAFTQREKHFALAQHRLSLRRCISAPVG